MDTSRTDQTSKQSPQTSPDKDHQTERDKARRLTERDAPDEAPHKRNESSDADKVYRPNANVDNQQSASNTESPEHNIPDDTGQTAGVQVTKDKSSQKDNINDKADKARSERRNG